MFICSSVYLFVCCRWPAERLGRWSIKTKLGTGTHVDPKSVLVKVKVKVIWRHLANANKTRQTRFWIFHKKPKNVFSNYGPGNGSSLPGRRRRCRGRSEFVRPSRGSE